MISFFPVKAPKELTGSNVNEKKFFEQFHNTPSASIWRGVLRFMFVGIRVVEMGDEAWDLRTLDDLDESEYWKSGWKIWYENGARSERRFVPG